MPFSYLEKQVFKRGYRVVAGIDEVGRGSLAGPVAAAVVVVVGQGQSLRQRTVPQGLSLSYIKDSKQLSEKRREEIFEIIKDNPNLEWRVSFVWPKTIDRLNIWQATLLAWRQCLRKLNYQPDFLFLDGKFNLEGQCGVSGTPHITQKPVIKGDQRVFLLSLASIIAKVSRDRLMKKLDKKYPDYGLFQHKGYGTKLHLERLKEIGPSEIHRRSFRPVFKNLTFKEKVYFTVSRIPRGRVMTYQEVAKQIGHWRAHRAVGNVLNKNANPRIPCHRVIRRGGQLGGYNKGPLIKEGLLKKEGALASRNLLIFN